QRPALSHAGALLEIETPGPAMISCDKLRIEQVIRNLIVNACQAMPEGGRIMARLKLDPEHVQLAIQDSGPGFSTEALDRFGEPFFSEREGGMGIGLTLAREVVQAHDGSIQASNTPQGGALIVINFPLHPSTEDPS
ncbi:MAG: ATP-binding protein, partial [Roseibacillus sp.]|nr:ATP-binding protein [Roseibacillus sp.]